jgi:hypothetical protein
MSLQTTITNHYSLSTKMDSAADKEERKREVSLANLRCSLFEKLLIDWHSIIGSPKENFVRSTILQVIFFWP